MQRQLPGYLATAAVLALSGCFHDDDDATAFTPQSMDGVCPMETLSASICDPDGGNFSSLSSHPYFPFAVGNTWVLEGEEEGAAIRVEIEVLDQTETVAGVETRVIRETETEDDELIEISHNFFAVAADGSVCYFGEDVDNYEDGVVVDNEGSWRAGEDSNLPGIQMPGSPAVGQAFFQEFAPGEAEDMAEIIAIGGSATVPAGTYNDVLTSLDTNPLEGCEEVETKQYARGVGLIFDDGQELTSFE